MATVHRAIWRGIGGLERVVALKRLLPHLAEDESFVRAFVREAKVASLLQHGNIVQLYELGRVGMSYFIAMEYIQGRDLRVILRQARRVAGPPPVELTIALLTELLDALDYAHTQCSADGRPIGLVHRDVSPSNLIISHTGHLKVIDFGIAKATLGHLLTNTGRIKGKLSYMAPEVLARRTIDARSDLFSASVIAHELLTATPLFAAKDDLQIIERLQNMKPPPPSTRNPLCPPELDDFVQRGLAKDPDERWSSAAEMRAVLADLAASQRLVATNREVSTWVEEAFGMPPPARLRLPLTPPPGGPGLEPKRAGSNGGEPDDEVMDIVWGVSAPRSPTPFVLDEIPDVSHKAQAATSGSFDLVPSGMGDHMHTSESRLIMVAAPTADRTPEGGVVVAPSGWMTSNVRQMSNPAIWPAGTAPPSTQPQSPGLVEEAGLAARRAEAMAMAMMAKQRRRSMLPLLVASVTVTAAGAGVAWLLSANRRAADTQVAAAAQPADQGQAPAGQAPPPQTAPAPGAQAPAPLPAATPAQAEPAAIIASEESAERIDDRADDRADDRDRGDSRRRHIQKRRDADERARPAPRADRSQEERAQEIEAPASEAAREERVAASTMPERAKADVRPAAPAVKSGGQVDGELRPLPVQVKPPLVVPGRATAAEPSRPKAPLLIPASRTQREGGTLRPIRFPPGEQPPANVVAKLCIDPRGSITSVTVLTSVSPGVRNAVQRALSQLRYRPVVEAGERVPACFASGFPIQVE